jgi:hypothetical protein
LNNQARSESYLRTLKYQSELNGATREELGKIDDNIQALQMKQADIQVKNIEALNAWNQEHAKDAKTKIDNLLQLSQTQANNNYKPTPEELA